MHARIRWAVTVAAAAVALVATMGVIPASATDPETTPRLQDIVGVGSDTTQDVVGQDSGNLATSGYTENVNAISPPSLKVYSFDATGSATITPAQGCAAITRPNGSSSGITALLNDQAAGLGCIDFARSSRVKNPATDGNLIFVPFAKDGVTWATYPTVPGGSTFNAPINLTTAQLGSIYNCTVTNWNQVGGQNAAIKAYLPQSGSGTRSFFLSAIGVTTPGPCVLSPAVFQENNGEEVPSADRPNAILPYSIAKYIAQTSGVSADVRGGSVLKNINGTKPLTSGGRLNTSFTAAFLRDVFNVIKPEDAGSSAFVRLFGRSGFICQRDNITQTFGFAALPASQCGYV